MHRTSLDISEMISGKLFAVKAGHLWRVRRSRTSGDEKMNLKLPCGNYFSVIRYYFT